MNVLINAYAVSPNWGSEPGLGWNWIVNLSRSCNVFVITEGEWRSEIEEAVKRLPQRDNIHFYYNPLPDEVRKMCWNQGDWRFYKHYRQWQEKTLEIAQEIIRSNRIDVMHQLNMIGFREPGSLWKIKDIPFVWGPVGGYGWTTLNYLDGQPFRVRAKALLKNAINAVQGRFYPLSNHAMRRADLVFAANSNVYKYIKRHHRADVVLLNETGCYEKQIPLSCHDKKGVFNMLWVGKFDYRKQIGLAIRTVHALKELSHNVRLTVVGDTNNPAYTRMVKLSETLGVAENIEWTGKIPNARVHRLMQEADIFLFTSIDEGTPHVVLEAIQNNLPVVCFDTCGQGDVVTENVGRKIPLANSKESPAHFAQVISGLINEPEKLTEMRHNCSERQRELSWERKMEEVIDAYHKILDVK